VTVWFCVQSVLQMAWSSIQGILLRIYKVVKHDWD
jgi:hypothetical protein